MEAARKKLILQVAVLRYLAANSSFWAAVLSALSACCTCGGLLLSHWPRDPSAVVLVPELRPAAQWPEHGNQVPAAKIPAENKAVQVPQDHRAGRVEEGRAGESFQETLQRLTVHEANRRQPQ